MMNKRGGGVFQTILNSAMVIAVIYFVFFFIFGLGGGFKAAFNLGEFVATIPLWFWLVIAMFWLFSQFRR